MPRWARVLAFDPPHRVCFSWDINTSWQIETDRAKTSEVEITFTKASAGRTHVVLTHAIWTGTDPGRGPTTKRRTLSMYAVFIEVTVSAVDREEGLKGLREQVVPTITQLPGFQSGVWLPGNADGRGALAHRMGHETNARAMADHFGPGSSPQAGSAIERWEVREVAATA